MKLYSPFTTLRPSQEQLAHFIAENIKAGQHCICHAPTGLGKTAAALAAILPIAEEEHCKILFLTSRHTQHAIIRETTKLLRQHHQPTLTCTSLVRKQNLCAQEGAEHLPSTDFHAYCKHLKENNTCTYYIQYKNKTPQHLILLEDLSQESTPTPEHVNKESTMKGSCPYETTIELIKNSTIIIADYNYAFHTTIRETLLKRIGTPLDKIIIVVDEAHNLPSRLRALLSSTLTTTTIKKALIEAKEHNQELIESIITIQDCINNLTETLPPEKEHQAPPTLFKDAGDLQEISDNLEELADHVRKEKKVSSAGTLAYFLKLWNDQQQEHYARIITHMTTPWQNTVLKLTCLDPAVLTANVLTTARGIILMSGTLTPTTMYKDILGFPTTTPTKEFESPFPEENKSVLIVPATTTKYEKRNVEQYKAIASTCASICNAIPGNTAIYFPSYHLQECIHQHLNLPNKNVLKEIKGMTTEEKNTLLTTLKNDKNTVLLAAATGSFGEGIDLPGVLSGVIVVGLPLEKPNLETQALINYYDKKYGKGWEYGYTLPALTKAFQNIGRCIRTEQDKGVLLFLDERYLHQQYKKSFPTHWKPIVTLQPVHAIETFFNKHPAKTP